MAGHGDEGGAVPVVVQQHGEEEGRNVVAEREEKLDGVDGNVVVGEALDGGALVREPEWGWRGHVEQLGAGEEPAGVAGAGYGTVRVGSHERSASRTEGLVASSKRSGEGERSNGGGWEWGGEVRLLLLLIGLTRLGLGDGRRQTSESIPLSTRRASHGGHGSREHGAQACERRRWKQTRGERGLGKGLRL